MSVRSISLKLDILESVNKAIKANDYVIGFNGSVFWSEPKTHQQIRNAIVEIEQHNRQGAEITFAPRSQKYSYFVLSNFTPSALRQFRNDGFNPCIRITTAPETYQVIVRTKKFDDDNPNVIKAILGIAEKYKAEAFSKAYLPGFYTKNKIIVATSSDSCKSINCTKTQNAVAKALQKV